MKNFKKIISSILATTLLASSAMSMSCSACWLFPTKTSSSSSVKSNQNSSDSSQSPENNNQSEKKDSEIKKTIPKSTNDENSKKATIQSNKLNIALDSNKKTTSICKEKAETQTLNPDLYNPNILKINPAMRIRWNKIVEELETLQTNPESITNPKDFINNNIELLDKMETLLNKSQVYNKNQKNQIKFDIYNLKSAFEFEQKSKPTKSKSSIITIIGVTAIAAIGGLCYYLFN